MPGNTPCLAFAGAMVVIALTGCGRVRTPAHEQGTGRLAFVRVRGLGGADQYVMNADGSGLTRTIAGRPFGWMPGEQGVWSPDGSRLAFLTYLGGAGDEEPWANITVVNADGSGLTELTSGSEGDYEPAWSPDGTKLAFMSLRDGNAEIYVMSADGSGVRRLTDHPERDGYPAWSPDGTRLAFVSDRRGNKDIYIINADGSGLTRWYGFDEEDTDPAWSLDGTLLAFASRPAGNFDIFVMNADGSGLRSLTNDRADERFPVWLPVGRQPSATAVVAGSQPSQEAAPMMTLQSFGPRFAPLDSQLAPLLASLDSVQALLRRDSGTARADSALIAFQGSFARRLPVWGEDFESWFQSDSMAYDSTERYFSSRGLIFRGEEGTYWLEVDPRLPAQRFGAFLTTPLRTYLEIRAQESGNYESDGSLSIPWDTLADRIVRWEVFLGANPGFARWDSLWSDARGRYDRYLSAYVRGLEHTPLILDEVLPSYERLLARHPQTQTARFVRGLLDVLRRAGRSGGPEHEEYLRSTPRPAPGQRRPGS